MSMKCPFPMLSLTLFPHCIPCLPSSGSCKVMKGKGHMFLIEPIIHYSVNLGGNGSCMFHHEWVLSQVLKAKKTGGGPPLYRCHLASSFSTNPETELSTRDALSCPSLLSALRSNLVYVEAESELLFWRKGHIGFSTALVFMGRVTFSVALW